MERVKAVDPKSYYTLENTMAIIGHGVGVTADPPIKDFCTRICARSGTPECPHFGQEQPPQGCRSYEIRAASEEEAEKVLLSTIETEIIERRKIAA